MNKKYIKSFITRVLISIIIFLAIGIFCNLSDTNLIWFKNNIYNNNISLRFFNNIYKKYIDKYIPFDVKTESVMTDSDKLLFTSKKDYLNGVSLDVGKNYNVYTLCGGIVVYIGNKEGLGNTVVVQGTDGVDYWYSNIDNLSVKLYDYIENKTIIGSSKDEYIYLTFLKDGEYIDYEDYI